MERSKAPEIKKRGCVALSLRLHSGVDYFLGLPLDDLNDMAKVVLEIGKKARSWNWP